MNEFKRGIYFGANITGAEGGANNTKLVCENLGNNAHYTLAEVNEAGAVVRVGSRGAAQRLSVEDLNAGGLLILGDQSQYMNPGESVQAKVGSYTVTIESTNTSGVLFNGEPATPISDELEAIRYPKRR